MVEVQLRGFPHWTESDDLKWAIDECGYPTTGMSIKWTGAMPLADVKVSSWTAADSIVAQLNGFEFTPGYPLQVRIKPGQQRPSDSESAKGRYSASPHTQASAAEPRVDPENSVHNCIGAGRIEGWFLQAKSLADSKGFGHVQSYSFEGNLVYRQALSPLLKNVEYRQREAVTFEVVMVKGQAEAVRLAPEGADTAQAGDDDMVAAYEEEQERAEQQALKPSWKSQKRREREEADGRVLFFGGFSSDLDEDVLWKFAEQAGVVKKVKLFYDTTSWKSKGCGKVNYASNEDAERALQELAGTVLHDRIVTVEPLGQAPTNRPPKRPAKAPPRREDMTQEIPKQLPLSMFSEADTPQEKLNMCVAAFEDLLASHDPDSTGLSMIIMIRNLVMEVNDIFGPDVESLQAFANQLRQYPWFRENQQVVKWQASKQRVNISKINTSGPLHAQWRQQKELEVEQRKLEQEMKGQPVFELPQPQP